MGNKKVENLFYDNSVSGLVATNVQDAIDEIIAGTVTASNGLNKTYNDIRLGGDLDYDTYIVLGKHKELFIGGTDRYMHFQNDQMSAEDTAEPRSTRLYTLGLYFDNDSASTRHEISHGIGGLQVQSNASNFAGMYYSADYSADFINRSLIDKEYADNLIKPLEVTYAELKNLIDSSSVIVGKYYKITDYATKYVQPITNIVRTESIEALIVKGISDINISNVAYSQDYPEDIIYYDFYNDQTIDGTPRNGWIFRRIDTVRDIDIAHDFSVRYRRWKITADSSGYVSYTVGKYLSYKDSNISISGETLTVDSNDYIDCPTLCNLDDLNDVRGGQMKNIFIGNLDHDYLSNAGYYSGYHGNNVLIAQNNSETLNITDVKFSGNCFENTIWNKAVHFNAGFDFRRNIFTDIKYVTFNSDVYDNVSSYIHSTVLASNAYDNIIGTIDKMNLGGAFAHNVIQSIFMNGGTGDIVNNKIRRINSTIVSQRLEGIDIPNLNIELCNISRVLNMTESTTADVYWQRCSFNDCSNWDLKADSNFTDKFFTLSKDGLDLTSATHVYDSSKSLQFHKDTSGTHKVSWIDASNVVHYDLITN